MRKEFENYSKIKIFDNLDADEMFECNLKDLGCNIQNAKQALEPLENYVSIDEGGLLSIDQQYFINKVDELIF